MSSSRDDPTESRQGRYGFSAMMTPLAAGTSMSMAARVPMAGFAAADVAPL
jgi:hypothetical protein